jgi:predicted secreted protein
MNCPQINGISELIIGGTKVNSRIVTIIMLIILTLTLVSCFVTSRDTHVKISCDDFTENPTSIGNNFEIEIGDKIYVELCSNPSTGFEWSYEMSGDMALKEEDHDFEAPESDVPGAAGKETWTFEGIEEGRTVINMEYSQPWEGGIKSEWTYLINVVVE